MPKIDDQRTPEETTATAGFIVATDKFMSGWGEAPGRSYFAVPFDLKMNPDRAFDAMNRRPEMIRVRMVGPDYRPRLRDGDHLSICTLANARKFWQ